MHSVYTDIHSWQVGIVIFFSESKNTFVVLCRPNFSHLSIPACRLSLALRIHYSDVWHIEYMFDGKAHTTEESALDCLPVLTDDVKRMAEKWARYEGWIR